ncbi:MAG: exo-alpha-sialidase, partial [Oscillospiraceae bacterium]|nr:exo-alpha-sialidase [Oscillospiraceae bacterium]
DPTFAYISAMDSAGALDYATQITNFTLETKFARFAPEGVTSGSAITPRIYLRLNKTALGYTGYFLTITGNNDGTTGALSLNKMVPTTSSTTASKLIKPFKGVSIAEGVEHTIKVEAVGATFNVYYDGELLITVVDDGTVSGDPYLSGSVGVGAGSQKGSVKYDYFKLTLPETPPAVTLTNEFADEFVADLSEVRDTSPWEQGFTWGANAKEGDLTVADGKLSVILDSGFKNPSFAYITAKDAMGADAAEAMEDYEFEVKFSRFAPEGVTDGNAVNPRIYFRLKNTPQGYTGYYLALTGTNASGGGTMSLNKMTPTATNSTASTLMKPYWSGTGAMGSNQIVKIVAEGNTFKIYYNGDLMQTFVDEGIGGVDPYLTGTVAVGAAVGNPTTDKGTVKYEYAKVSVIEKTEDEKKFKKYTFYSKISDFADLWEMDTDLDIVDKLLVNTGDAAAKAVLKSDQYLSDYAVDANVTLPAQGGVSILGRYVAENNSFYELALSKTEGLVLSKTVSGTKTVLKTATPAELYAKGLMILADATYQLKLQMYGDTVECWIDDQVILSYEDTAAITSGVGGLILDPGAKVKYLEIAKVNAIVSVTIMEDTNRNGIEKKLADYLVAYNGVIEVPVGRTPDIKYLYLKAEFFNGDVKYFPVDTLVGNDYDVNTLGDKTLTVSYLNKTAEIKYKVVDRTTAITQLIQDITALNVDTLTKDNKAAVYALEDLYNDLTVAEKATISDQIKDKLAKASEKIEFLVYPELVGTQIVFEDRFDTAASAKQYNSDTTFTGDRNVGYWYVENGVMLQHSVDDSVRTSSLTSSNRLDNRNFEVNSISVDVQIIDRNVWVGLDFHANGGDKYRFYLCDKTSEKNSATGLYGNRIDLIKAGTRITREWKYEDFWQPGQWINMRVTYVNGVIRCYIDDVLWIEYEDSTNPLATGTLGFISSEGWTKYDNLVVRGVELNAEGTGNKYNTDLEPGEYTDDFEDETPGKSPSHWIEDNREDNWKIMLDGTDLVYGNANSAADNYSHSWLHVFDQDVDYAVKVKVTEVGDYPLVGLTARYNYDESYIKAGYDFTLKKWFIKVRYGWDFEETVAYSAAGAPEMQAGAWYDLRLNVVDEKLALFVGDSATPVVTADAGRKVMTGRVGVFTERCNVVIDDVDLTMISGQSHVQDGVLEYTLDYTVADPQFKYPSMIELADGRYLLVQNSLRLISSNQGQLFEATTEFDNTNIGESHIPLHDGTYLAVAGKNVYRSTDECKTWTKITELPLDSAYTYAHTGDRLCEIKLEDGTYRLFVTIDARYKIVVDGVERTVISETYYSDDGGYNWTRSVNTPAQTTNLLSYAETNIIKATDGTIIQYCSYNPSDCLRYTISHDNGVTWEGDYALPQIPGGVVSFCVKEDPYNPGTYYMVTVYNFSASFNNGFPRHRISLFMSKDGYSWDFLCDVDRWGDISDGGRRDLMQNINMYMTITEDHVVAMFGRAERYSATEAHNIKFGRFYRLDKDKLEVQEFPQEYIIDGKHITYIEAAPVIKEYTLNGEFTVEGNEIIVHYYDGSTERVDMAEATVIAPALDALGKVNVIVDYELFRAVYTVEVVNGDSTNTGGEADPDDSNSNTGGEADPDDSNSNTGGEADPDDSNSNTGGETDPDDSNSDTGDNAAIVLFGSLLALSALAAGILLIPDVRKNLFK